MRSKVACFYVCNGKKEIGFVAFAADCICLFCYIYSQILQLLLVVLLPPHRNQSLSVHICPLSSTTLLCHINFPLVNQQHSLLPEVVGT